MKRIKIAGAAGALVASALIGGTLFSSVLAAPATTQSTTTATISANLGVSDAYLETFMNTLASELGVDRSALGPAALAAANAAVDAAEAAGDITADRATQLRDELSALDNPEALLYGHGVLGGPGHDGPGMGVGFHDAIDAAATALGIDESDLESQLRDGTSLAEIATAQDVAYSDVVSAITDAVSSDLTTAVSDGRITQDQADTITSDLQTWLDAGGQADAIPFGFEGPHGGHGPRGGMDF